jgi:ketosteroid isomerase-like protein
MIELIAALALQIGAATSPSADVVTVLRKKDQALLDAIAPGDHKVWDEALAADAVYVDENGTIIDRKTFMNELQPLGNGASGSIAITDYQVHLNGDLAVVIHRDDERENYHGQPLHAAYLMTETWRRENKNWKLWMVHAYVVNNDPPSMALPLDKLDEYVGRYRAAPDLVYVIRRDGLSLTGGREGSAPKPIAVEIEDVLFSPGAPRSRKLFRRDERHRVVGFFDRREGVDIVWKRLSR